MNKDLIIRMQGQFDQLVLLHPEESGLEFWFARDLQEPLGYARWENFLTAIQRAIASCKTTGFEPGHHFRGVTKLITHGKGGQRGIEDFMLGTVSVGEYLEVFNSLFVKSHNTTDSRIVSEVLFSQADAIAAQTTHNELALHNKVVLSIAIRVRAEIFITGQLRIAKNDPNYWFEGKKFGNLLGEFKKQSPADATLEILESVSVTVSSNIHLNSFMYEPILDLSTGHLCHLYESVKRLASQ